MQTKKLLSVALMSLSLLVASPVFAKGGTNTSTPGPVITTGSCDLQNPTNEQPVQTALGYEWNTAVIHPNLPGGAAIHIVSTGTEVYASSICLEEGWSVKYKESGSFGSRTGFDARFLYNGLDAVDIRYVFGRYEAKYY